jgi:hypothetical protein
MVTQTVGADVTGEPTTSADTDPFRQMIAPQLVVPMVTFLASKACDFSHRAYAACAGRYSRVFVGLTQGWLSPAGGSPSAEDVAAHLDQMSAIDAFTVPGSLFDEVAELIELRRRESTQADEVR